MQADQVVRRRDAQHGRISGRREEGAFVEAEMIETPGDEGDGNPRPGDVHQIGKGRGIGDCGAMGGYAWTGTSFALTAFSMMGECRGIGSDDWITLYRSEIK